MSKTITLFLISTSLSFVVGRPMPINTRALTSKRGIAFNDGAVTKLFPSLTWGYNWLSTGIDVANTHFEYVPMLHSDGQEFVGRWKEDVSKAVGAGTKHVLSFNEPDQCGGGGACMQDVYRTVAAHKQHVQPIALAHPGTRIGAPAVTNGVKSETGSPMGTEFLKPFIQACNQQNIKIDFVVAHWYDTWPSDPAGQAARFKQFKDHMTAIYEAGGRRKIWLTEFAVWSGDQKDFLGKVMPWLDEQPWIERYAFHYAKQGILVSSDMEGLTELGKAYVSVV